MSLRTDLKKLAQQKPELRKHLAPLFRKEGASFKYEGKQGDPMDMAYAMTDMLAEIERGLPTGSAKSERQAVKKALSALEKAIEKDTGKKASRHKRAGGFTVPLLNKLVTPRVVMNAMKKTNSFDMSYFDFRKIQFDTVDPMHSMMAGRGKGLEAIWRVFPAGEFDNRKSEYAWGTVFVKMESSAKGIVASAAVYVKI